MDLINKVKTNLKNIPGRNVKKKYLVIECDDWGGIRMPSREVYDNLTKAGLPIGRNRFNNDTLANGEDLDQLFSTLSSVRDCNSNYAVMTAVSNMANPDFERIRLSGFTEYHYEKFPQTLLNYGMDTGVFSLWKEGIENGIFMPELHGREHLASQIWLQKLREGDKNLRYAFDQGFTSLKTPDTASTIQSYRSEFSINSESQIPFLKNSIKEAVNIFIELFSYKPKIFVPSNALFHPLFENALVDAGIEFLYVNRLMTYRDTDGKVWHKRYKIGQTGHNGLTYYTRNCAFEPTDINYRGINFTMMQIDAAFRWGKIANVSTHRTNFVGGIDQANRKRGIGELKKLLDAIVSRWPDIEFVSSRYAHDSMIDTNN